MRHSKAHAVLGLAFVAVAATGCKYQDPNRKPFQPPAGTAAAVYVDQDGNVVGADAADGTGFSSCSLPGRKSAGDVCRGLSKQAEVQSVNSIVVIRSKINPVCIILYSANGAPKERCF